MASPRLQRIAQALVARARAASFALLALGLAAFLLLPLAGKRCYLDEKALLVGGAQPTIRQTGAFAAWLDAFQQALPAARGGDVGRALNAAARATAAALPAAGPPLAFYRHNFSAPFAGDGSARQCSSHHAVVRTRGGDGSEGFVLLLPLHSAAGDPAAAAFSSAAGVAMAAHLAASGWLAKDFVLVFVDQGCSVSLEAAQAWLSAYNSDADLFAFPRAGLLQQALVLEASSAAGPAGGATSAQLSVHGAGGQLPNLDLYYLVKRNFDLHTAVPVGLHASGAPLPSWARSAAAVLGDAAASLGLSSASLAQHYSSELSTLAAFGGQLAGGEPTGAHAPFLGLHIDSATLAVRMPSLGLAASAASSSGSGSSGGGQQPQAVAPQLQAAAASVLAGLEMSLRTLNNLQERLHHSTALYALVSPDRFVSVAAYLAPPGLLLLAGLTQLAAASQAAGPAPLSAWRAAWLRVAAAHALAFAATEAAPTLFGEARPAASRGLSSGGLAALLQQLAWAALAGLPAAAGPPALLAAMRDGSSSDADCKQDGSQAGAASGSAGNAATAGKERVRQCTTVLALAAAVLQGAHLLLGQWARCFAFLLAAVPVHALAASRPAGGAGRLAANVAASATCAAVGWRLCESGAGWLAALLLPHVFLSVL